tara:strand:- start:19 stop:285 length:267 start_codon:yes stop_codon:yes gene_type:complete
MEITAFYYELGDQTRKKSYSPLIFQQRIGRIFDELGERFFRLERRIPQRKITSNQIRNGFGDDPKAHLIPATSTFNGNKHLLLLGLDV